MKSNCTALADFQKCQQHFPSSLSEMSSPSRHSSVLPTWLVYWNGNENISKGFCGSGKCAYIWTFLVWFYQIYKWSLYLLLCYDLNKYSAEKSHCLSFFWKATMHVLWTVLLQKSSYTYCTYNRLAIIIIITEM